MRLSILIMPAPSGTHLSNSRHERATAPVTHLETRPDLINDTVNHGISELRWVHQDDRTMAMTLETKSTYSLASSGA